MYPEPAWWLLHFAQVCASWSWGERELQSSDFLSSVGISNFGPCWQTHQIRFLPERSNRRWWSDPTPFPCMLLLRAPSVSCEGGPAPLGQKESAQRLGRQQGMLCKFEDFFGLRSGHSRKPLKEFFDRSTILKVLEQSTDGNPGSAKNIFPALDFRALLNRKAILPAHRGILALVFNVSTDQRIGFFNLQQFSKSL